MKAYRLEIGTICNNNCWLCPSKKDARRRTYMDIKREISSVQEDGIFICGGEPTLHNDFFRILDAALKKTPHVYLFTNARAISITAFAERLAACPVQFVIKLNGHTPKIHDFTTKTNGSYAQTLKGIQSLIDARRKVVLHYTISELNFPFIVNFADKMSIKGIEGIIFTYPVMVPDNREEFNKLVVSYSSIIKGIQTAESISKVPVYIENIPLMDQIRTMKIKPTFTQPT